MFVNRKRRKKTCNMNKFQCNVRSPTPHIECILNEFFNYLLEFIVGESNDYYWYFRMFFERMLNKQSTCYCWMKTDQKLLINMKKKMFPIQFPRPPCAASSLQLNIRKPRKNVFWTPIAHWVGAWWELQLTTEFQWIIAWMIGKPLIRLRWWLLTSLKSVVASTQDSQPT